MTELSEPCSDGHHAAATHVKGAWECEAEQGSPQQQSYLAKGISCGSALNAAKGKGKVGCCFGHACQLPRAAH